MEEQELNQEHEETALQDPPPAERLELEQSAQEAEAKPPQPKATLTDEPLGAYGAAAAAA